MKSSFVNLSIILGTYNRLVHLKKCLGSFLGKIETDYLLTVIDAGSSDGTQEYLKGLKGKINVIREGKKLGQARSLNRILRKLKSNYVCWISDDNVIKPDILNSAVKILDENRDIGMVGLKVKDVTGPYAHEEYIGGISAAGILNVNQGLMRLKTVKEVGFFDETFPDYGMDLDLTTKILLRGYNVVYTKDIAILHYRDYKKFPGAFVQQDRKARIIRARIIYIKKYKSLCKKYVKDKLLFFRLLLLLRKIVLLPFELVLVSVFFVIGKTRYAPVIKKIKNVLSTLKRHLVPDSRDWNNILRGQYISIFDLWYNRKKNYYLVQNMNKSRK